MAGEEFERTGRGTTLNRPFPGNYEELFFIVAGREKAHRPAGGVFGRAVGGALPAALGWSLKKFRNTSFFNLSLPFLCIFEPMQSSINTQVSTTHGVRRRNAAAAPKRISSNDDNHVVPPPPPIITLGAAVSSTQTPLLDQIAKTMYSMRVRESTIGGYTSKVRRMKEFFTQTDGMDRYMQEGEMTLPLDETALSRLFSWLATNPKLSRSNPVDGGEYINEEEEDVDDDEIDAATRVNSTEESAGPKGKMQRHKGTKRKARSDDTESDEDSDSDHEYDGIEGFDPTDYMRANIATMSASCLQGYKSALLWYYDERKVPIDEASDTWLNNFVQAYKRFVAKKKENGVMKLTEGKSFIQFQDYIVLSQVSLTLFYLLIDFI